MAVQIGGTQWDVQFRRMFAAALDSTAVWTDYNNAVAYAANREGKYVPYAGQIVSVTDGEGAGVYKLVLSSSITSEVNDGRGHYQLERIGGISELKETFTLRDNEEQIKKIWEFLEGLKVLGELNAENVKAVTVTVDKGEESPVSGGKTYVQSGGYTRGGKGFGIYKDTNGNWTLDIDNVSIRGSLGVSVLNVNSTEYLGGEVILTVGGSIEATSVETNADGSYKVHFKNSDADGREIYCQFVEDDLVKHQTYNEKAGARLYWLKVDEVGSDCVTLSRLDGDTTAYSVPCAGDEIVHLGNVSDKDRQAALVFSARTQSMRIYTGIDTTSLNGAVVPIDLNPTESRILARFVTMSEGVTLDKAWTDIALKMGVLQDDVASIKGQQDKQFIIWFGDYTPTLTNTPYTDWVSDERDERDLHLKDIFYNRNTSVADGGGRAYRFEKDPAGNYLWHEITDKDTLLALEKAAKAQDTADGKRRVFVEQPTVNDAYDPGDMWTNATYTDADGNKLYENDTLVVQKGHGKAAGEPFDINDWRAASTATTAYLAQLGNQILGYVTDNIDATITDIQNDLRDAQYAASEAAQQAASAAGIANSAQQAAENNTAALQVINTNITALVQGEYLNSDGTVKTTVQGILDTAAGQVTALAQRIGVNEKGVVTNFDRSGLVATATWAAMFSDHTDENGVTVKAQISTLIENGISQATIKADQITIEGSKTKIKADLISLEGLTTVNNNFKVLADGSIEAVNGKFTGEINATSGTFANISSKDGFWRIDSDGKMHATDGEFTGKVTATSGTFSGKIDATSGTMNNVTVGSGDGQLKIYTDENDCGIILAGNGDSIRFGEKGLAIYSDGGYIGGRGLSFSSVDTDDGMLGVAASLNSRCLYMSGSGGPTGREVFQVELTKERLDVFLTGLPASKAEAAMGALYLYQNDQLRIRID